MEDFVTFEIAKKLKEKGFREKCLCYYIDINLVYNIESPVANNQLWFCHNKYDNIWHRDNIDAPTISQVLKWLREIKVYVMIDRSFAVKNGWHYYIVVDDDFENAIQQNSARNRTWETTALAAIEYVLDNLMRI